MDVRAWPSSNLQAGACVCLLRAVNAQSTERSSLWSRNSSDISPSNNGGTLTPFSMMQTLSFTPKTQSTKTTGSQALTH